MTNYPKLLLQIARMKNKLAKTAASDKGNYKKILQISQQLDKLLVEYFEHQKSLNN